MAIIRDIATELCTVYNLKGTKRGLSANPAPEPERNIKSIKEEITDTIVKRQSIIPETNLSNDPTTSNDDITDNSEETLPRFKEFALSCYRNLKDIVKEKYSQVKNNLVPVTKRDKLSEQQDPVKYYKMKQMIWYGILPQNTELRKIWYLTT